MRGDQSDEDTGGHWPPTLIPMRLPAALLGSFSVDSLLSVRRGRDNTNAGGVDGAVAADSLFLAVAAKSASGGKLRALHPLEVVEGKGCTEYYRSSAAVSGLTDGRELHSVGRANRQYEVRMRQSVTSLKEIGKKTRMLLEQERRKRKEIIRLDDDELPSLPKEAAAAVAREPPPAAAADTVSRKRGSGKAVTTSARKKKRRVPSNVDGWMPDVCHLGTGATSEDDRSAVVRLHGLPLGSKPDHVRKLFQGLGAFLVFALPSFKNSIQGWDTDEDRGKAIVERHPGNFRIYVKFASAPLASAALERSGESIGFDLDHIPLTQGKGEVVAATISLSPIPKAVAFFLLKNMAIHAQKGEPIADTLAKIERRMGQTTLMAWQMAMKKLSLKHRVLPKGRSQSSLDHLSQDYALPKNKAQYRNLALVYNRLIDMHEQLESDSSVLLTHAFDPTCLEDSVHRITQSVSNWLLDEIDSVGSLLKESRQNMKDLLKKT